MPISNQKQFSSLRTIILDPTHAAAPYTRPNTGSNITLTVTLNLTPTITLTQTITVILAFTHN